MPGSQIRDLAHFLELHHNQRDKKEEEEEEERERAEIRRQQMSKARLAFLSLESPHLKTVPSAPGVLVSLSSVKRTRMTLFAWKLAYQ